MSSRGQVLDRMMVLRQRVWYLSSQLAELQNLRTRVEKAELRGVGRRSKVTSSWAVWRQFRR